jgi:large subunit ribosomal protein L33
MARRLVRPIVKLRCTAGAGYAYAARKNRRNDPDWSQLRTSDPMDRRHVGFWGDR